MRASRERGARTAAITASPGAPIADAADIILVTLEMDRSWCHTVGYVSPIVAAAVAADLLGSGAPQPEAYAMRLADGIVAAHALGPDGLRPDAAIGAGIASAQHLLVVASGTDRITARELVLKVEEAAWVPSATRDLETFLHGHLPATGPATALVLVLLEREGLGARAGRARQALAAAIATGIRPAAILGSEAAALIPDDLTPGGRIVVPEAPSLGNAVAALLGGAGPLQLVTLEVSAARGTNPDPIRRDDPIYLGAANAADAPDH
jgi:fructoselysine-6-P-deglycase FrlB-like protein